MSAKIPPNPGKDVIYIDVDDDITGIIDKIENSKEKVVALVLPKRAASLQSIVNMKLLKRSADQADKNPVLITSEAALLPLAGAAGLHVAKNLQSAPEVPHAPAGAAVGAAATAHALKSEDESAGESKDEPENVDEEDLPHKIDYGSVSVGALAVAHEAENPETIDLDDEDGPADKPKTKPKAAKAPKDKKNKVPNFDRFRMMLILGALGLVALIVFIILALFVLPKATVKLTTTSEPVSANFNLTADTGVQAVNTQSGVIPAKVETTDQTATQSVTATGQQNNGQKASGSVSMTVCVTGSSPSDVPAGSGVSTNGLAYITQQAAHFGPTFQTCGSGSGVLAESNNVDITAQQAGSKYNTSITGGTISGYSGVTASGSASGGTDNIVTVLSQSDVDNVSQKLTSGTAGSDFSKQFEDKLASQGEYVFVSTLKTSSPSVSSSPAVGQPASTANVTAKVTYTVFTVQKSDLSQAIQAKLASQIDKTKQKLNGNFLNDADITANQTSASVASLAISENTTAVPIINVATVKQLAAGKKSGDIKSALNGWAGVKNVDVQLSPFWVSKAPSKTSKIKVILAEDKSSSNSSAQ